MATPGPLRVSKRTVPSPGITEQEALPLSAEAVEPILMLPRSVCRQTSAGWARRELGNNSFVSSCQDCRAAVSA